MIEFITFINYNVYTRQYTCVRYYYLIRKKHKFNLGTYIPVNKECHHGLTSDGFIS